MSRILLISSNTTTMPMPVYPLGMSIIASSLNQDGHEVKQLDPMLYPEDNFACVLETIKSFVPDFIGISIRNIDTVDSFASEDASWYLPRIKKLVADIKSVSSKPVIIGGPAFSIMPEQILEFSGADYGIAGEGEFQLKELIRDLSENINSPKIRYSSKPLETSDFISPSYEQELVDHYLDKSGLLNYQTKRGCPYTCNYCSYPLIEGKKIRYQDPEFVAENLLSLQNRFGVDTVFFTDSVFNDPKGHYLEIAAQLIKKQCNIKWAGYFRPEEISRENMELLKESGLYAMEVGSDAACDATLKGMGKSFSFDSILAMNESCLKAEVPCAHFFIFGGYGETDDTIREGIQNINLLENCAIFIFSGIRVLPDTGIHKIGIDQGIIPENETLLKPYYYISPEIDKNRMDDMLLSAFKKRKDVFFPPEEGYMRMKALNMFGFKGLLWDMAINLKKK